MAEQARPAYNIALRLAALVSAVTLFPLRAEIRPEAFAEWLMLICYAGPPLLIAFSPWKWASFQIGFALGDSIGMLLLLIASTFFGGFGFPQGPHNPAYGWAGTGQISLFVASFIAWVWNRRIVLHAVTAITAFMALFYPGLALIIQLELDQQILGR